jgi:hypothetical protein
VGSRTELPRLLRALWSQTLFAAIRTVLSDIACFSNLPVVARQAFNVNSGTNHETEFFVVARIAQ